LKSAGGPIEPYQFDADDKDGKSSFEIDNMEEGRPDSSDDDSEPAEFKEQGAPSQDHIGNRRKTRKKTISSDIKNEFDL
jgi:hypothetical protein